MPEHLENSFGSSFFPFSQAAVGKNQGLWIQVGSEIILILVFYALAISALELRGQSSQKTLGRVGSSSLALFFFMMGTLILLQDLGWSLELNGVEVMRPLVALLGILGLILLREAIRRRTKSWDAFPLSPSFKGNTLAEDKYKGLLENNWLGVFEWKISQDRKSPIFWSDRMPDLLGLQPNSQEPTLDFFLTLIHPEDRSAFESSLRRPTESGKADSFEYRIRVGDRYKWFRIRKMIRRDEKGQPICVIGSIEDVHDQRVAEEKVRAMNVTLENEIQKRTHQLEVANRAKTRFLANMSHELRTPLGLVLGFSELLQDNKNLDLEAREYVDLINKNGEILSRVINDLLDLSKIEAGKLKFQFSRVPIGKLIEDFNKAFSERAARKNIKLTFQTLCPENESIVTDEIRLKQIVYNLLSNAIKFTDEGSVQVTVGKNGKYYFLDVVDSGIGIPESEREHIFDEFARGEMADSGRRAGTGLGLRLAQNLSQALGGDVELISSQVGKGSHFRLTIVSDERRLQQQAKRRQEATVSSKLNDFEVFVLDDNEDNIRLAEIFLKKLGCKFRGFTSARSLFAEMVSAKPDLILLDINMPEMNGFEVFDHLRQSGYKNPIWALTAYSLNEDIQAILEYGFDDFIRKPITIESMKRKLTFELRERTND